MSLRHSLQYLAIITGILLSASETFSLPLTQPVAESMIGQQISQIIVPQSPDKPRVKDTVAGGRRVIFPPPPEGEGAGSTTSGGRRGPGRSQGGRIPGSCTARDGLPLTALMPADSVGTTLTPNPTLFWYLPQTKAKSAQFMLRNQNNGGEEVYKQTFDLPKDPGVIQLKLPKIVTLEPEQAYLWKLALICEPNNRNQDEIVWGTLKRQELQPEQQNELKQAANPIDEAILYAKFYLWNETITRVAQMRDSDPQQWQYLLKSVGIEDEEILNAPLVGTVEESMTAN